MFNLEALLDSGTFWIGVFLVIFVVGHFFVGSLNTPSEPKKKKGK